jgi:hypothetical protein
VSGHRKAHSDAFMALLAVGKPSTIGLFSGEVPPLTRPPYILIYFAFERIAEAPANNLGASNDAAGIVADHVEGAVLDKYLDVNGWETGKVRQDSALDPNPDESTAELWLDAVQTYRVASNPALLIS